MRRPHRAPRARNVALSTVPIHESGSLKRTHGERPALPRWWWQAGLRTLGYLLDRRFPSLEETVRWLAPLRFFVPITAAGQRRIYTGFPFNKAQELCTYTREVYKR